MNNIKVRTDLDIVKADAAGIYLGNIFTVDTNLKLPLKGKYGSTITWESEDINVIANDGKVTRPAAGSGNIIVMLRATVKSGNISEIREYKVTVLEQEKPKAITAIKEVYTETPAAICPKLPTVVITVKEDGSFGTALVAWDSAPIEKYGPKESFKINGTISGTNIKAVANITVTSPDDKAQDTPPEIIPSPVIKPYELSQVALLDGVFTANRDRNNEYLLSLDNEQLLYNFRDAAGLDKRGATPLTGWDAPDCNLRGHTTGHCLTALAQAYASCGDVRFKDKIDYMVEELGKCQDAMADTGKFGPGFFSGYSEEQFIKLEQYAKYPEIWAPYYTLHKIMAGMLDCYELAGNAKALDIAKKIGYWVFDRLGRLPEDQLLNMWALYIAGEYGSINETLAKLYALTGNQDYLTAAKLFDNDKLFMPLAENIDTLDNVHANQHIPEILGAIEIFSVTRDPYYYKVADHFWSMVIGNHTYNIGGTGSGEMFRQVDQIAKYINDKTAETCATYNMLKLTRKLFFFNPDSKYMDYYERALYNHILASQDQSGPTGGSTYFMPLFPGMIKEFDLEENHCCHGTGMENHTKYQDSIYFQSLDQSTLYINLYIASRLNWEATGFNIVQSGNYLLNQASVITIEGSGKLDIKLRVPLWAEKGFTVSINGVEQDTGAIPGTYVTLSREWASGDTIRISVPFSFRLERTPDDPTIVGIFYGPLVMVGKSSSLEYIELDLDASDISRSFIPTDDPLTFIANGITLVPNFTVNDIPYHAYFKVK